MYSNSWYCFYPQKLKVMLHKICENKGFHWPVFFRVRTVLKQEKTGKLKPVFSHILRSVCFVKNAIISKIFIAKLLVIEFNFQFLSCHITLREYSDAVVSAH